MMGLYTFLGWRNIPVQKDIIAGSLKEALTKIDKGRWKTNKMPKPQELTVCLPRTNDWIELEEWSEYEQRVILIHERPDFEEL